MSGADLVRAVDALRDVTGGDLMEVYGRMESGDGRPVLGGLVGVDALLHDGGVLEVTLVFRECEGVES